MKNGVLISAVIFLVIFVLMIIHPGCRKRFDKRDASAVVDRISMHYGNVRIFNGFTLGNVGEENLSYQVTEEISWLEVANANGQVSGQSQIEITCVASRQNLPQGNYSGELNILTSAEDYTMDVYLNVDMFLITFINPAYSTINIRIDTVLVSADTNKFSRNIGKNDSVQFGFFQPPDVITYYAQTSGRYTDSTQLGLMMDWEGQQFLNPEINPRYSLDVSKAYFHLSIINNNEVLNPLYINAGTQYEMIENIFIFQSTGPLPIGYYRALNNTVVRAFVAGQSTSITWSNNGQFEIPFTANQQVIIDTYSSDTTAMKSISKFVRPKYEQNSSRIIHLIGDAK